MQVLMCFDSKDLICPAGGLASTNRGSAWESGRKFGISSNTLTNLVRSTEEIHGKAGENLEFAHNI